LQGGYFMQARLGAAVGVEEPADDDDQPEADRANDQQTYALAGGLQIIKRDASAQESQSNHQEKYEGGNWRLRGSGQQGKAGDRGLRLSFRIAKQFLARRFAVTGG
jgi:hypothetical protein